MPAAEDLNFRKRASTPPSPTLHGCERTLASLITRLHCGTDLSMIVSLARVCYPSFDWTAMAYGKGRCLHSNPIADPYIPALACHPAPAACQGAACLLAKYSTAPQPTDCIIISLLPHRYPISHTSVFKRVRHLLTWTRSFRSSAFWLTRWIAKEISISPFAKVIRLHSYRHIRATWHCRYLVVRSCPLEQSVRDLAHHLAYKPDPAFL